MPIVFGMLKCTLALAIHCFPTGNFKFNVNVIFLYFLCSDENDLVDVVRPGEDFKRIMSYVKKRNKSW